MMEYAQSGQARGQSEIIECILFEKECLEVRHAGGNRTLSQRIKTEIQQGQVRQPGRKGESGQMVVLSDRASSTRSGSQAR